MKFSLSSLDHPVIFVLLLTVAVVATSKLAKWGLTQANLPGPASLFS